MTDLWDKSHEEFPPLFLSSVDLSDDFGTVNLLFLEEILWEW